LGENLFISGSFWTCSDEDDELPLIDRPGYADGKQIWIIVIFIVHSNVTGNVKFIEHYIVKIC